MTRIVVLPILLLAFSDHEPGFAPSFPLRLARKEVALVLEAAGDVERPLLRATLRQFDRALELGHGDEDMSAIYYASASAAAVPGS